MSLSPALLLAFFLCILAARSRPESSQNTTLSVSSNTTYKYTNASTEPLSKSDTVPKLHNVWPKDGTFLAGNKAIIRKFQEFGLGPKQIYCSQLGSDLSSVNFFTGEITDVQAFEMNNMTDIVLTVTLQGYGAKATPDELFREAYKSTGHETLYKRDGSLHSDPDQRLEMVYLSQPRNRAGSPEGGVPLSQLGSQYRYDLSSGAGARVYMLDSGANYTDPEFDDIRSSMKWAGPSYRRPLASDRYPEAVPGEWPFFHAKGHGTKVLSKITGKKYGVIKRPSAVVVVRYPLYTLLEDLLDMVTWVIQDWQDHRDETIVKVTEMNIALGFRLDQLEEEDILKLPQLESRLVEAMNEGILPIVSAGNRGGPVYKYPALFPAPRDLNGQVRVPPAAGIMVIGSTNNYGKKSTFSCTAEWVQLTAPGEDIMMAQSSGSGTSFSTAGTTGIGAYLSALGDYADDQSGTWASRTQALRTELMTFAYPRTCGNLDEYPLGVWNKVTEVNGVPGTWEPTNAQKRDIVDDVCTYVDPVSSATSSATSSTRVVASLSPSSSSPTTQKAQYHTTVKSHQSSLILGFNASSYLGALGSYLKENCLVTASNCSEGGQISDVYSYDGENLVKGTIDIAIPFSQWQNANQLYAMQLIAVKAASSSESNCQVYDKQDGSCFGRRTDLGGIPCENEPVQVCHFTNATEVVVNDFNDGVVGQLIISYSFHIQGDPLECSELVAIEDLAAALVVLFPELGPVKAEITEFREEVGIIDALCGDANQALSWD